MQPPDMGAGREPPYGAGVVHHGMQVREEPNRQQSQNTTNG